jgi:hypothetical protein
MTPEEIEEARLMRERLRGSPSESTRVTPLTPADEISEEDIEQAQAMRQQLQVPSGTNAQGVEGFAPTKFIGNTVGALGNIATSIGTGEAKPTFDEAVETGGNLLTDIQERTNTGFAGDTPLPGKLELLRRGANLVIPESVPPLDTMVDKAGEMASSLNPFNILESLPQLAEALFTPEGRQALGSAFVESADIAEGVEKGEVARIMFDLATMSPKSALVNPIKALSKVGKIPVKVATGLINSINNVGFRGGAKKVRAELPVVLSNPQKKTEFLTALRGEVDPFDIAQKGERAMEAGIDARRASFVDEFNATVDENILFEKAVVKEMLDDMADNLRRSGADLSVDDTIKKDDFIGQFNATVDEGFQHPTTPETPNIVADTEDFIGQFNEADLKAVEVSRKVMERIYNGQGTLGEVRNAMLMLDNVKSDPQFLGSKLKDSILGKNVKILRDALNTVSPELKAVNAKYAKDSTELKLIQDLFSIRKGSTGEATLNKMMEAFSGKKFADKRLEMLKNAERISGESVIPSLIGTIGKDWLPPSVMSNLLSGGQVVAATGIAQILGGLPAAVVTAIATGPFVSPRVTVNALRAKGFLKSKVQQNEVLSALEDVWKNRPEDIAIKGATYGSAIERFLEREQEALANPTVLDSLPVQ